MGVYIREAKVTLVTNKEIQEMFHFMMNIDWQVHTPINTHEQLVACMEPHLERIKKENGIDPNISDLVEISKHLSDTIEKALIKCYTIYSVSKDEDCIEIDDVQQMGGDFPHWYGETMFDGTGEHICANDNNPMGLVQNIEEESFSTSMSYSGYNHLRNTISKSLLGSPARYAWSLDFDEAYVEDTWKRNLYFLINGSDCEGVIVPEVVRKIASSLGSERAMKTYHAENSEYDIGYFDQLVQVFLSASKNGHSVLF